MATQRFSLSALSDLDDGRVRAAFEQAIARCETDCKDRPAVTDSRKVTLSVTLSPIVGEDGEMESCNLQFQVLDSVPKRKSKVYNMKATRAGLVFNELSPDDIHQMTLDQASGPREVTHAG